MGDIMIHSHTMQSMDYRPFTGPVAREENQAAHGGVCLIEKCSCGYERLANVNRRHREQGPWQPSAVSRRTHLADSTGSDVHQRVRAGGGGDGSPTCVSLSLLAIREGAAQPDAMLASAYTAVLRDAEACSPHPRRRRRNDMPCLTKYTAAICPECEGPIVDDPLSGEGLCECPHQPRWICPINGEQWEPSGHLPEAAELAAWIDDNTVGWDVVRGRRNRWAVVPVGAKFGLVTDCDREAKVTWFDADADARQAMASGSDR